MSHKKRTETIFEKWVTDLEFRDRTMNNVSNNFDALFDELSRAGIPFDTVHDMIPDAARAHYPSAFVANYVFKNTKDTLKNITYQEFLTEWRKKIYDKACQSFYSFYEIEQEKEPAKNYGGMSAREYRLQRKHADSFEDIDLDELKKKMEDIENSEPNITEKKDGETR